MNQPTLSPALGRSLPQLIGLQFALLSFCFSRQTFDRMGLREFGFSLVAFAASTGILTFGSPVWSWLGWSLFIGMYQFLLAVFLWVLFALIGAKDLKFGRLFCFLMLTFPASTVCALPFHLWLPLYEAHQASIAASVFLVAWWIGLLSWFLLKTTNLSFLRVVVALFIPIACLGNLVVWADQCIVQASNFWGTRRELKLIAGSDAVLSRPAVPKTVSASTTGWLTAFGKRMAESNQNPRVPKANKPSLCERVAIPAGHVDIYQQWLVPGSSQSIPSGFVLLTPNDPVENYRRPLQKLLAPLAEWSRYLLIPACCLYLAFIFLRPSQKVPAVLPESKLLS